MVDLKRQVEALLFASGRPMLEEQLAELARVDKAKVHKALVALKKEYDDRDSAITIFSETNGWKMTVKTEHLQSVSGIVADTELSRACMETLAVIAYKHPKALQSEVVDNRGSGAYEHIAELERLGFVRKESSGRSFLLKLTDKFFNYFDVHGEKDIRAAFKGVKPPERKLGLDVVPVAPHTQQKLGVDMEVVSVEPKEEPVPAADGHVPGDFIEKSDAHRKFLDDLDKRISELSQRNDAHAQDPLLQRKVEPAPEAAPPAEQLQQEQPSEPSIEVSPPEQPPGDPAPKKRGKKPPAKGEQST